LLIFFFRNPKKENCLKSGVLGSLRFINNFTERQLTNARHARDRAAFVDLFAHEKWQDEIVRSEIRFAHQIAQRGRSAQSPRTVNQFPHVPSVRGRGLRRKFAT